MIDPLPNGVDDWKAELSLGQVFGKALVVRVLLQAKVGVIIPDLI